MSRDLSTPGGLESTASLLAQVRKGDSAARDRLAERYLVILRRWSHGRLPARVRDLSSTDDLVQTTLLRALERVPTYRPKREGAFLGYLRRILVNQIRDELRRSARRPGHDELPQDLRAAGGSPLEAAIGAERLQAYEKGLAVLPVDQREAVILRFELGFTHQEIADAIGCPTADAARMVVTRALVQLTAAMDLHG